MILKLYAHDEYFLALNKAYVSSDLLIHVYTNHCSPKSYNVNQCSMPNTTIPPSQ